MNASVHIIDDEDSIRDALEFLFASRGIRTVGWASGEAFLAAMPIDDCGCILLDVRMAGMSGPDVFDRLRLSGEEVPVIFLTGHADVPVAVQTLKAGAFDFVEKPFNDNHIVNLALAAMEARARIHETARARADLEARLATLSVREKDVMRLMLQGWLNKQVADTLDIAIRTVEVHRGRVLTKMGARNAVELGRMLGATEID
ncbi:MAG: response regulator [Gemmobacter sp.]|nr:response regulator [Gemmobacter sp.]